MHVIFNITGFIEATMKLNVCLPWLKQCSVQLFIRGWIVARQVTWKQCRKATQWHKHIEIETKYRHFANNICKFIFVHENICILMQISLRCEPYGPINDMSTMMQIMAYHRTRDKSFPQRTWTIEFDTDLSPVRCHTLPKPMLTHCQLDHSKPSSVTFDQSYIHRFKENIICKMSAIL